MLAKVSVVLFLFYVVVYFYLGVTTTPYSHVEIDSVTYHIPIAENIAKGNFLDMTNIQQGLGFYPGNAEGLLSLFVVSGVPLNLFNVFGLILFWVTLQKLGRLYGLGKEASVVFGTTIALLPTVVRLIPTQTVDIWLGIFFAWALILLFKVRENDEYWVALGVVIGLLVGVKYSGILYAFALFLVYLPKLIPFINLRRILLFAVPFSLLGLGWYFRNWLVTGSPIYPVPILGFGGHEFFKATTWTSYKVLTAPGGLVLQGQAAISEMLVWALAPLVGFAILTYKKYLNRKITSPEISLFVLGVAGILIFLPQPSGFFIQTTVSNMRFLYPTMISFVLLLFIYAKEFGKLETISIIALVNTVPFIAHIQYRPKLFLIWLVISFLFLQFGARTWTRTKGLSDVNGTL